MEKIEGEQIAEIQTDGQENISDAETENGANSYGRFKSAEELVKAYTNLEKEFTKRSQRLKSLEKEVVEAPQPPVKEYMRENWRERVSRFMEKTPEAQPFTAEIAKVILENKLDENPNCLELALSQVLLSNYKAPSSLTEDEEFLNEHVYKNEKIRDKIIKDYLCGITQSRAVKTIGVGGQPAMSPQSRPKTIGEAGKMVIQMAGRGK